MPDSLQSRLLLSRELFWVAFPRRDMGQKKGWLHNLDHLQKYRIVKATHFLLFCVFCFFHSPAIVNDGWGFIFGEFLSRAGAHFPLFLYSFPAFRRNNDSDAATFGMLLGRCVADSTMALFSAVNESHIHRQLRHYSYSILKRIKANALNCPFFFMASVFLCLVL